MKRPWLMLVASFVLGGVMASLLLFLSSGRGGSDGVDTTYLLTRDGVGVAARPEQAELVEQLLQAAGDEEHNDDSDTTACSEDTAAALRSNDKVVSVRGEEVDQVLDLLTDSPRTSPSWFRVSPQLRRESVLDEWAARVDADMAAPDESLLKLIHQHQHPKDCSKAKFLVFTGCRHGFGFWAHLVSRVLELGLATGRVVVVAGSWNYAEPSQCPERNHLCFFRDWSSCSLTDIDPSYSSEHGPTDEFDLKSKSDSEKFVHRLWPTSLSTANSSLPPPFRHKENARVTYYAIHNPNRAIPKENQLPDWAWTMRREQPLFFRSRVLAYIMRPRAELSRLLRRYEVATPFPQPCAVIHVRRSDGVLKKIKPQPTRFFLNQLLDFYKNPANAHVPKPKGILVQSADPTVFEELRDLVRESELDAQVVFTPHTRTNEIVTYTNYATLDPKTVNTQMLNSLANMYLASQCSVFVLTQRSAWSRLLWETANFLHHAHDGTPIGAPLHVIETDKKWYIDHLL